MTTTAVKSCTTCNRLRNSTNTHRSKLTLLVRRLEHTQIPAKRRVTMELIHETRVAIEKSKQAYDEHYYGECEIG